MSLGGQTLAIERRKKSTLRLQIFLDFQKSDCPLSCSSSYRRPSTNPFLHASTKSTNPLFYHLAALAEPFPKLAGVHQVKFPGVDRKVTT